MIGLLNAVFLFYFFTLFFETLHVMAYVSHSIRKWYFFPLAVQYCVLAGGARLLSFECVRRHGHSGLRAHVLLPARHHRNSRGQKTVLHIYRFFNLFQVLVPRLPTLHQHDRFWQNLATAATGSTGSHYRFLLIFQPCENGWPTRIYFLLHSILFCTFLLSGRPDEWFDILG